MAELVRPETLWDFACRVYAREGVASTCLTLQDAHGLDVDVVLGVLWVAAQGRAVDERRLDAMRAAADPVREPIGHIRALRRALGRRLRAEPEWQATYEQLRGAELSAERIELERIDAAVSGDSRPGDSQPDESDRDESRLARDGLRRYATACGASEGERELRRLVQLVFAPGSQP